MINVKLVTKNNIDFYIIEILEFNMEIKKNIHATAKLTGYIPEEVGNAIIFQQLENGTVIVNTDDDENSPVYYGIIHTAEVAKEGNGHKLYIEAISSSVLLDYKKNNRSFQNSDMTYKNLVQSMIAETEEADFLFQVEDCKIGSPIYQYDETDWAFLKRIASQLGTSVLSAAISSKPQIYIGMPKGTTLDKPVYQQERIWFNKEYYLAHESNHFRKEQFLYYDVSSYERWRVGDSIRMADGQRLVVMSMGCSLNNSLLHYRYTLALPEMFYTARYENHQIAGASIVGTVLDVKGEYLRIKLDIDTIQLPEEAFWYDWFPETGNLMYCMPEVGERVIVTFDDDIGNARVSGSLRVNGTGHPEMQDVSKRYFTSADYKRMYLLPDSIGFVDLKQEVPLKIELSDINGASIESSKNVTIMAKGGIWLKGNHINFKAPKEISLIKRDIIDPTVLNMCNGFDSVGKYGTVKMEGTNKKTFPVLDSDSEEFDVSGAEVAILSSTPYYAGSTELERQITGTTVNRVNID
ncbi:MAG: hypothetical protein ACRDBO_19795 [Lachnospiraceae bacterium]